MMHAAIQNERIQAFRELHATGSFVMPNPWDTGSARLMAFLGFRALATTSSGFAWTLGRTDATVSLERTLENFREIAAATDLPVNGDFEGGFAIQPDDVAANVHAAIQTGIAGLSIEDSTQDTNSPLYEFELAVQRVRAARNAIDRSGRGIVLTARSEGFIAARPDLDETIRRLCAYSDAGADCLYAPGISTENEIAAIVAAVAPKPVNVLVGSSFTTAARLAELGVRRISVGGAIARSAWHAVLEASREIAQNGTFTGLDGIVSGAELDRRIAESQSAE